MKLTKKEIEIKFFVSTPTVVFVISIATNECATEQFGRQKGKENLVIALSFRT